MSRAKPDAEIVTVTPKIARDWLAHNVRNRHPSKPSVSMCAEDMRNGNWELNGEAIKFNGVRLSEPTTS